MILNKKIISLIDNHLHEIYDKQNLLDALAEFPSFIEEHYGYRALIGHNNELKAGDSFSFSKEGLLTLLDGHKDRFQGEDVSLIIYKAHISGYNLKKLILIMKDQGIIDDYTAKFSAEDEIISLEINDLNEIYNGDFWTFLNNPIIE